MSKTALHYVATVVNGVVKISNRAGFDEDMKRFEGKRIQFSVKGYKASRSLAQNAYYWGSIIPYVQEGLMELGFDKTILDQETVHDMLKGKFLKEDLATDKWEGEFITHVGSTTDLNKLEFADYIEDIRRWAAEFLSIDIPDPEQQVELRLQPGTNKKL